MNEPNATALVLLAAGALLLMSALGSRLTGRTGLPVALVFIGIGMLAGSQGIGGIEFESYRLAFRLGTAALVLILFDGGLNTSLRHVRRMYRPASVLATLGVILTAALVAAFARLFGLRWSDAALLGAIVSSTDAAAVFAALRASGVQLKRRVGLTLELESGLNDAMAVILTTSVTSVLTGGAGLTWATALGVPLQLVVGGVSGVLLGVLGRLLLRRARLTVAGLYPVMSVGLALAAFAVPTLLYGSGFIAVYVAAMTLGEGNLPYRPGLLRIHDALAWFSQVGMFVVLGLLVFPLELVDVALPALGLALALAVIARPVAVALCLLPFRFAPKETAYIGWVGLRGAVPIILATFPVLAGAPRAERMFNLVFFIVLVNAVLPGVTLGWVTRRLGLVSRAPEPPTAALEITSTHELEGEIMSFHIDPASAVAGQSLADVPFPPAAAAMLVIRGRELVATRGNTVLLPGDHVYVFASPRDRPMIQLLFGREELD